MPLGHDTEDKSKARVYKVSELTRDIKIILEGALSEVWLEGEVSNFTHHASGHMYFRLKDEGAVINAVLFRGHAQKLKFKIEDGIQVVCFGRVTVYERSGQYQIVVEKLEPKGIGALQLAFEQLKKKLFGEGLFDAARKKSIPLMPFSVGIVTSNTGAAIKDILHILSREAPFLRVIVRPTIVQGESAKNDIAAAIQEFNEYKNVDLLIVGRGGGSLEDLWAFNEEIVARAIAASLIPVISAVGHEIDWSIADFVADLRAETPSAAAKLIVNKKNQLLNEANNSLPRLQSAMNARLHVLRHELVQLSSSRELKHPLDKILEYQQCVDNNIAEMNTRLRHCLILAHERLKSLRRAIKHPRERILEHQARLQGLYSQMATGVSHKLAMLKEHLRSLNESLKTLNPSAILSRGYSLSLDSRGAIIKEAASLRKGDKIKTFLSRGSFISVVEAAEDMDNPGLVNRKIRSGR